MLKTAVAILALTFLVACNKPSTPQAQSRAKPKLDRTDTCADPRVDVTIWDRTLDMATQHDEPSKASLSGIATTNAPAANQDLARLLLREWDDAGTKDRSRPIAVRLVRPNLDEINRLTAGEKHKPVLLVQLGLNARGRVESAEILRSGWGPQVDELILTCIRKSLFRPPTHDGSFVASSPTISINF